MGRGQRIDQANWPGDGPHRHLLELLDRIHQANGLKSRRAIAAEMHLESASYVNDWLRGLRLPVDARQVEALVRVLDGDDADVRAAVRLYEEATAAAVSHPWAALAEGHIAWTLVDARRDASAFQEAATAIAERLGALSSEAEAGSRDDPWLDTELAARFTRWTDWLLRTTLAEATCDLSPAEAALLTLVPLLHHTHMARTLAALREIDPLDLGSGRGDGPRREYETFLGGRRELVDRATARRLPDRDSAASEIGWWLFRRWVVRFPQSYRLSTVRDLLSAVDARDPRMRDEVLAAKTVQRFLAALRLDLSELGDTDRKNAPQFETVLFAGEPHEQRVRELLIGQVLSVAYALTIDLVRLPEIVARHLGIPHPVDLAELRETVGSRAKWVLQSDCLVLRADCHHPAELEGLRQYAGQVDALLYAIRQGCGDHHTMQALTRLPSRASADDVRPDTDDDGRLLFQRVSRFRLDERRVQDLLMGEQLYQDRGLAIRELYQNALDACRYRRARLAYRRQGDWADDWEGRIRFTQGVDENGRAYLECLDNGIGMTEAVLTDVFAQAGTRFTDTTEFLVESADWKSSDPPIPFHANSRFGIGVLSYFMIADEIEVITRPLDRGHRPHPTLKVSIFGPGHLFRIEHLPDDRPAGTSVRLFLRAGEEAPSCVEELRRLLGIAEFDTHAAHGDQVEHWQPGVLKQRVRPSWETEGLNVHGDLVPWSDGRDGQVIWCENGGGLLVDGLYVRPAVRHGVFAGCAGGNLHGAIVNLTGENAPGQLSVDRRQVLSDVSEPAESLLAAALDELMAAGGSLLNVRWVATVTEASPRLADLIAEAAARLRRQLTADGAPMDVHRVGCFLQDSHLVSAADRSLHGGKVDSSDLWCWNFGPEVADHVLLWRLIVNGSDSEVARLGVEWTEDVLEGRPSDTLLFAINSTGYKSQDDLSASSWYWQADNLSVRPGHILWAAKILGLSPYEAAERAVELGVHELDPASFSREPRGGHLDLALLSLNQTGGPGWRCTTDVVPIGHVAAIARRFGVGLPEIRERMEGYGFQVAAPQATPARVSETDLRLLSWKQGAGSWIEHTGRSLPASHLVRCAWELRIPVDEVCHRLAEFGFVADRYSLPDRPDTEDALLFDWDLPWRERREFDASGPLRAIHLLRAALRLNLPIHDVASRLARYGIEVPYRLPDRIEPGDVQLLGYEGDSLPSWWRAAESVLLPHVVVVSGRTGIAPDRVVERLSAYGMDVAPADLPDVVDEAALRFLSENCEGRPDWLDATVPVARMHLVRVFAELGVPIRDVADRLAGWGMTMPSGDLPEPSDVTLLRTVRHGMITWISSWEKVTLFHLLAVSWQTGMSVRDAAERLRWLGMDVPDVDESIADAMRRLPRKR
ncbi:hypothetical protein [Actinomadura sp. NEAU-AAG7]|uniref:wHTH domain-containing protein n=1 Tax=Actinomadura sp. NEAU-AAG7 TaxID=2839640 RepID=UPI001BE4C5B8|nr:hypothetical protein [Actinomadura sp. NEAU-AAG7]MBT2209967.1 hypothetical protein [Actinomadura sp. NEAU-AAG7]